MTHRCSGPRAGGGPGKPAKAMRAGEVSRGSGQQRLSVLKREQASPDPQARPHRAQQLRNNGSREGSRLQLV